jgi:hypothetical protein
MTRAVRRMSRLPVVRCAAFLTRSMGRARTALAVVLSTGVLLACPSTSGPQATDQQNPSRSHSATLLPDGRWLLLQGPSDLASVAVIWDSETQISSPLSSRLQSPGSGTAPRCSPTERCSSPGDSEPAEASYEKPRSSTPGLRDEGRWGEATPP